jgi:hypothetical protein
VCRFEILHGGGSSNFTDFDPGPILDEAVARIVPGWVSQPNGWLTPSGDVVPELPCFSTDLGSSWIVVERLLPVLSEPDSQDGSFFLLHSQDGSGLECSRPLCRDRSYEDATLVGPLSYGRIGGSCPGLSAALGHRCDILRGWPESGAWGWMRFLVYLEMRGLEPDLRLTG